MIGGAYIVIITSAVLCAAAWDRYVGTVKIHSAAVIGARVAVIAVTGLGAACWIVRVRHGGVDAGIVYAAAICSAHVVIIALAGVSTRASVEIITANPVSRIAGSR